MSTRTAFDRRHEHEAGIVSPLNRVQTELYRVQRRQRAKVGLRLGLDLSLPLLPSRELKPLLVGHLCRECQSGVVLVFCRFVAAIIQNAIDDWLVLLRLHSLQSLFHLCITIVL